jgi:molybdopterin converting factor small subunit
MKVHVKCFASLIKDNECNYHNARSFLINAGDTVSDLIRHMDLPPEQIKLIFINGLHGDSDTVLQEGDQVAFAPATFGM